MKYLFRHILVLFVISNIALCPQGFSQGVEIINETELNSAELEFAPSFYRDGIVFLSSRKIDGGKPVKDKRIDLNAFSIFKSVRAESGNLGAAEAFSLNLTTPIHEGPLTFNTTGDRVYFSRNYTENGKPVVGEGGKINQQLLSASRTGEDWSAPEELPFNSQDYNIIHPTIGVDNDQLIMASDMPGGYGGYDLYISEKVGNSWTFPQNMGPEINSDGNDVFPFLHADGMLYYSSDRTGGRGGLDLYYTIKLDGANWVAPVNMGEQFNTSSDDFSLIVDRDKKNGYFASDRSGGQGGDDIYRFFAPATIHSGETEIVSQTKITIIDKESGLPISGTSLELFTLSDLTLDTDTPAKRDMTCSTDANGSCTFNLPPNSYYTTITAEGYSPTFEEFKVETGNTEVIYALDKEQDCVQLKGVIFNKENQYELSNVIIRIEESNVEQGELIEVSSDNQGLFKNCLECNKLYAVKAIMNGQIIAEKTVSTKNIDCAELQALIAQNSPNNGGNTGGSNPNNGGSSGSGSGTGSSGGSGSGSDINIELEAENVVPPVREGDVIVLKNIYYNFDDDRIRPDARVDLDRLVDFMKRYPSIEVELRSHTDSRGTSGYNYDLSQRRARNAVSYLVNNGISSSRISPNGYGETQILNGCTDGVNCNEQEHQYNRRTEVRITAINIPDVTIRYLDNKGNIISTTYSEYLKNNR